MATKDVYKSLRKGDKFVYNDRKEPFTVTAGYDNNDPRGELVLARSPRGKRYLFISEPGNNKVVASPMGRGERRTAKNMRKVKN
jgi:hypothetical protein